MKEHNTVYTEINYAPMVQYVQYLFNLITLLRIRIHITVRDH